MSWTLPEPMLAAPVNSSTLPSGWAAEAKLDGFRCMLARYADGRVLLRSCRGTDMTRAFPEIARAAIALPADTALDGELVMWERDRLAFERLQGRLNRTAASAARLACEWPAHFVAFNLIRHGIDLTGHPYKQRRVALETLFAEHGLGPHLALCPSTTDPAVAADWLSWSTAGIEGLVFKRLNQRYLPGQRAWRKYRTRESTEALVGAVTGSQSAPSSLLFGRYDGTGRLRFVGRSTVLSAATSREVGTRLAPAQGQHPWDGWTFFAGWGSKESLRVTLIEPELAVEIAPDVSLDPAGRWRHPVRLLRARPDLSPAEVPLHGDDI
ncbi:MULTISPECIES: ATP-dependent DNA ligase [unclassified Streptomyces]|uniref:ATP-dependent DNA ligase n=1 Tax=unclassified Streptomyces TaxID=2593676 RepID=UPI0035D5E147